MPWIDTPHGRMHVRMSKPRRRRCSVDGCWRWAERECDHPVSRRKSGTCDKALCLVHAGPVSDNLDWCPDHLFTEVPAL